MKAVCPISGARIVLFTLGIHNSYSHDFNRERAVRVKGHVNIFTYDARIKKNIFYFLFL